MTQAERYASGNIDYKTVQYALKQRGRLSGMHMVGVNLHVALVLSNAPNAGIVAPRLPNSTILL